DTMPCEAMYWWRSFSVRRSLAHQAPPWHSTSAGNGPAPRGLNTRASNGVSPWRRYSTSSTSNSAVLASRTAVVMARSLYVLVDVAGQPSANPADPKSKAAPYGHPEPRPAIVRLAAVLFCAPQQAHHTVINGQPDVRDRRIITLSLQPSI